VSKKSLSLLLVLLVLTGALAAGVSAQDATLRIGVVPQPEALPLLVAAQVEVYFDAEGVIVEMAPYGTAAEQYAALQSGEIAGGIVDLTGVSLLAAEGVDLRAVRYAGTLTPSTVIVAGAESGITALNDLRGAPIAVSAGTSSEYAATALLKFHGFTEPEISLDVVEDAAGALASGDAAAAVLTGVEAAEAVDAGAVAVASDVSTTTVLAFTADTLETNGDAVSAFLAAYESAVNAINADPEAYRDALQVLLEVPDSYAVPGFPLAGVPLEAQAAPVGEWLVASGTLDEVVTYGTLVDGSFLPEVDLSGLTIYEIIQYDNRFTVYREGVALGGLADALSVDGPITLFLPDDNAFATMPPGLLASLYTSPISVQFVFSYHIVPDMLPSVALSQMDGAMVPTQFGAPLSVTVGEDGAITLLDQFAVVVADIPAMNGLIHIISGVPVPERPS
jgi:NitT/TauT family transport system substrate-binding protein